MTYLIDGHNLIPKLPGMSLDQLDDEQELINLLIAFSRRTGRQVEVYFDQGQVSGQHDYQRKRVHVHFVRKPMIADTAIISRLLGIGKAAKNYTVVSSDREIQDRARHLGAAILSSQEFAKRLLTDSGIGKKSNSDSAQQKVNDDIQEWLDLFSKGTKTE